MAQQMMMEEEMPQDPAMQQAPPQEPMSQEAPQDGPIQPDPAASEQMEGELINEEGEMELGEAQQLQLDAYRDNATIVVFSEDSQAAILQQLQVEFVHILRCFPRDVRYPVLFLQDQYLILLLDWLSQYQRFLE